MATTDDTKPTLSGILDQIDEINGCEAIAETKPIEADGNHTEPRGAIQATDALLHGLALLEMFVDAIPDTRAKERYILWSALEKFEEAYEIVEMLPAPLIGTEVSHG